MVTTKFKFGMIFVILTLGTLFFNSSLVNTSDNSLTTSSLFASWRPDNQTLMDDGCISNACHLGSVGGTGTIDVLGSTDVNILENFNLEFKVSGFTQAVNKKIVMGFNTLDADNKIFTNNEILFTPGISLNSAGYSDYTTFSFKSPYTPGVYTLLLYAVFGRASEDFQYLSKSVNINVSLVNDSTPPVINALKVNGVSYSNDMVISGSTVLQSDVSDANLADVRFTTNNVTYQSMILNSQTNLYEGNFTTGSFSKSKLVVTVAAIDKGANNVTASYLFTLNNTGQLPDANIISFLVTDSVNIHDGKIDPIWEEVSSTPITELGSNGYIKTVQDESYIYVLLAYDSSYKWVSVEFNTTATNPDCMENQHDSWVFGTDAGGTSNYFGDYYFVGTSSAPLLDKRSDVFYETITEDSITYVELVRTLNTSDTTGYDYTFTENEKFDVVFASSQYHTSEHTPYSWIVTNIPPVSSNPNTDNPVNNIKTALNLQEISDIVFVISFVIVLVTVFIHISLRVVSKPIKHEKRIIYTNKLPNQPSSITLIKNFFSKRKNKTMEEKK